MELLCYFMLRGDFVCFFMLYLPFYAFFNDFMPAGTPALGPLPLGPRWIL